MLDSMARFKLFGTKNIAANIIGAIQDDIIEFTESLPLFGHGLANRLRERWLRIDIPPRLFKGIDTVLKNRGGYTNPIKGPNGTIAKNAYSRFWADAKHSYSNAAVWTVGVNYLGDSDPGNVKAMEYALEDQLARARMKYNVRIVNAPLRIEVDKPQPPLVRLEDYIDLIATMPKNRRYCCPGVRYDGDGIHLVEAQLTNDDAMVGLFGSPGSGKTQLAMSMLLTLAICNSPESLGMIICDPKAVDFMPLADLPHLARPIAVEPLECAEAVQSVIAEMDSRTSAARRGDRSFIDSAICLYIDEMSDLIDALPDGKQQAAFITDVKRLTQKGRGVGIIVIGATQRVYDIPAPMYSKFNLRLVGRCRNAGDSQAAAGVPGVQCHKLPGRGAFELFCSDAQGDRIQGFFVEDVEDRRYPELMADYIRFIAARWGDPLPAYQVVDSNGEPPKLDAQAAAEVIGIIQNSGDPDITMDDALEIADNHRLKNVSAGLHTALSVLQQNDELSSRNVRRLYMEIGVPARMARKYTLVKPLIP